MTRKPPLPDDSSASWPNLVGLAAFGLYRRMQTIMAEAHPYGHLATPAGTPIQPSDLARMVGERVPVIRQLLDKLVAAQVITDSTEGGGALSCPSMIRAADLSAVRSAAGSRGASRTNSRAQAGLFDAAKAADAAANPGFAAAKPPASAEGGPGSGAPGKALTQGTSAVVSSAAAASSARSPWVPDESGQALLDTLETDDDRSMLHYLLDRVAFAPAWVAELRQMLDPQQAIHGKVVTPAQMGLALRHYVGNGDAEPEKRPNVMYFGAYLRKAVQGNLSPVAPAKYGQRATARPTQAYDPGANASAADRLGET